MVLDMVYVTQSENLIPLKPEDNKRIKMYANLGQMKWKKWYHSSQRVITSRFYLVPPFW